MLKTDHSEILQCKSLKMIKGIFYYFFLTCWKDSLSPSSDSDRTITHGGVPSLESE